MLFQEHDFKNKLVFILVLFILSFFLFKVELKINIKCDMLNTLLSIGGNFIIALYIASVITKKQKDNELKINNCFQELDNLIKIIDKLRHSIKKNNVSTLDDDIIRYSSLISLQIQLINKYEYVKKEHKDNLLRHYGCLDKDLSQENNINDHYKMSLLQLERQILNIKSSIL